MIDLGLALGRRRHHAIDAMGIRVNTSKPSARATATSVMPAWFAVSRASAVGAETATTNGCAGDGGLLHHLERTRGSSAEQCPSPTRTSSRRRRPISLSRALCRPTSSTSATNPRPRVQKPAPCTARVSIQLLRLRQGRQRGGDVAWSDAESCGDARTCRHGGVQTLDPAQAAARGPGHAPAALSQVAAAVRAQPHAQLDALVLLDDLEASRSPRRRRRFPPQG